MLHRPLYIPPCAAFWDEAARVLVKSELFDVGPEQTDFSDLRVVVPTALHGQLLRKAMASRIGHAFIPPRITTLDAWLSLMPPMHGVAESARVAALYAELRNHAWLKRLVSARRNTDLLPLAQTLIGLCDELTQAMLPLTRLAPEEVEARWQNALSQFSPVAKSMLSDEAQLVWSIWKSQLDAGDRCAARFSRMLRLAENAAEPLVWMSPVEPSPIEQAFLSAYGEHCPVLPVLLDWRPHMLQSVHAFAWPEILAGDVDENLPAVSSPSGVFVRRAQSLEQEAQLGAQTIVDWLQQGKSCIAVVAQDRVAARRLRALLERAKISVADETGWKLSTTRAASLLFAWFDVVTTRAETVVLLDLLKSPYLAPSLPERSRRVMNIEVALRRANVVGGWEAAASALKDLPSEASWLSELSRIAHDFSIGRREITAWSDATFDALNALEARATLADDAAGAQLLAVLDDVRIACANMHERISLAEWRAFVALQIESTPFIAPQTDRRVVMLPLNGARLRTFDAVLMIGADAGNLPSNPSESLFFSDAVRRELGLATRETLQRQQLRDFSELLHANTEVVLSWQSIKNGEENPASPWIERLQLALERAGQPGLAAHPASIAARPLKPQPTEPPRPSARGLLPQRLSASAYNSLTTCPYQFFAGYMLGLDGLDELSDLPEKRDYGSWLHGILHDYHEALLREPLPPGARLAKLCEISDQRFQSELKTSAAALGYYVRWQKAMPAYIAWCEERESEGWRYEAGEQKRERKFAFDGGEVVLHGRIDRIDRNVAGELAVLDYKTANLDSLQKKLKQAEDHQLAFYGLLFDAPVEHASYVALEAKNEKTGDAPLDDYSQRRDGLSERAAATFAALSKGAELPANGVESACAWCDVRGLCRKGTW